MAKYIVTGQGTMDETFKTLLSPGGVCKLNSTNSDEEEMEKEEKQELVDEDND